MGTTIRPALSENNKYWIERHRYYELKHFCLQYPIWKKAYTAIDTLSHRPMDLAVIGKTNAVSDPTARCAIAKSYYLERMELVERVAANADSELSSYLIKAATEGYSYEHLKARLEMPCSRDTYYDRYRKFFWLLNKERD